MFVQDAGACLVTRSVLEGVAPVRFLWRESSANPVDNGWRIISAADSDATVNAPSSWSVVDFNAVCEIEPLVVAVYDFEVGTDVQIVVDEDGKRLVDTPTGRVIPVENYYVPQGFRAD